MFIYRYDGKFVVADRFIRTLKKKIQEKNMCVDKSNDIDNKCNNRYHKTNAVDETLSTYIDFNKESKKEDLKLEVDDDIRTSKYKNIFTKGYVPN